MKQETEIGLKLPVMEHMYTIQGEGYNCGCPVYLIRLGGCDIGCTWCDVKDSWNSNEHPLFACREVLDNVLKHKAACALITGGEPLMFQLDELCELLHLHNVKTFLETSGAYKFSGKWDWICVSPKKFKKPHVEMLAAADELKVIVSSDSDFTWAEYNSIHTKSSCKLFLQPQWDKADKILPNIIRYVKQNPQWRISLQTHKYINIP